MADVINKKEIDIVILLYKNDTEIQELFFNYDIFLSETEEEEFAILMLTNSEEISESTIQSSYDISFLSSELAIIFGLSTVPKDLYTQTFYVFKYGTIRKFFKDNWTKFMPEYDVLVIENQEKMKLFQEAFMREFDRFSDIIDRIYDILDVDSVPEEYLSYLAQLIGYEREDEVILNDVSFRELLKNIIEVYQIKGTNFSFELFFNFLGFEVTLKEFWFDKRFYYGISINPETNQVDKNKASFYLTSTKPTNYIPEGMDNPFIITEESITETLDLNWFNKAIELGNYTVEQLLGVDYGYSDTNFEYFKTNVMEYTLNALAAGDEAEEGEDSSLTAEQNQIIRSYSDFLTPIFIKNNILVIIPSFEDDGTALNLRDRDYSLYEINYLDATKNELSDTEDRFYSRTHTTNAPFYLAVADYHSLTDENEILEKISSLMNTSYENFWENIVPIYYDVGTIYNPTYSALQRRQIFYPLIDIMSLAPSPSISTLLKSSNITFGTDFSFKKGEIKRLSEAVGIDNYKKAQVLDLNITTKEVTIDDPDDNFIVLLPDDYIKLIKLNDRSQDGYYKIDSLAKNGTDTVITINTIDTPIPGISQITAGGFLQPYNEDWTLGKPAFPFLFDRVIETT